MLGAGQFLISVHFSAQVIKFRFSVNIILVQNDSPTKCFLNVTCLRSYHLTPSFVNQNSVKKNAYVPLFSSAVSCTKVGSKRCLLINFKTDFMSTFVSCACFFFFRPRWNSFHGRLSMKKWKHRLATGHYLCCMGMNVHMWKDIILWRECK